MNDKTYKFEAVIEPVPDHHGAFVRFPYSIRKEFGRGRGRAAGQRTVRLCGSR